MLSHYQTWRKGRQYSPPIKLESKIGRRYIGVIRYTILLGSKLIEKPKIVADFARIFSEKLKNNSRLIL